MIAAIIGPFIDKQKIDSKLQFFHIKDKQPLKLEYIVITQALVPKSLVADTKNLLLKYSSNKDRQNLLNDWNSGHCENKFEKFISFIRKVLVDNQTRLNNKVKAPK